MLNMKGFLKLFAIFLGTFFTAGLVSCSSDNDNDACCVDTYVYEGNTYVYTYCPDGTYTYSVNGEVLDSGSWNDWTTWDEIQEYCD